MLLFKILFNMKSFIVACLTGVLTTVSAADGKCRALAFSSGDEDAAYQAGVMKGITSSDKLTPEDYSYDAVSGVAGGAVNAVLLAEFGKGQEAAAADRMEQFWVDASHNKLYKNWFGGIARGLY
jgi:predicted acylesterase/phospholipase RssA